MENDFIAFLKDRPSINLAALAIELGVHKSIPNKIISKQRKIPKGKRGRFREIMQKYGYVTHYLGDNFLTITHPPR